MFRLVQFVCPAKTDAVPGRLLDWGPYFRFQAPDRPDQLVPQDDGSELEDKDDPELVATLSALYWFRRQEPLEDEE